MTAARVKLFKAQVLPDGSHIVLGASWMINQVLCFRMGYWSELINGCSLRLRNFCLTSTASAWAWQIPAARFHRHQHSWKLSQAVEELHTALHGTCSTIKLRTSGSTYEAAMENPKAQDVCMFLPKEADRIRTNPCHLLVSSCIIFMIHSSKRFCIHGGTCSLSFHTDCSCNHRRYRRYSVIFTGTVHWQHRYIRALKPTECWNCWHSWTATGKPRGTADTSPNSSSTLVQMSPAVTFSAQDAIYRNDPKFNFQESQEWVKVLSWCLRMPQMILILVHIFEAFHSISKHQISRIPAQIAGHPLIQRLLPAGGLRKSGQSGDLWHCAVGTVPGGAMPLEPQAETIHSCPRSHTEIC